MVRASLYTTSLFLSHFEFRYANLHFSWFAFLCGKQSSAIFFQLHSSIWATSSRSYSSPSCHVLHLTSPLVQSCCFAWVFITGGGRGLNFGDDIREIIQIGRLIKFRIITFCSPTNSFHTLKHFTQQDIYIGFMELRHGKMALWVLQL